MKANNKNEKIVYYNINGRIDRFSTYINNNKWTLPFLIITIYILIGITESL